MAIAKLSTAGNTYDSELDEFVAPEVPAENEAAGEWVAAE